MNNVQLYLSIGVPTFAVLLAWFANNHRFDSVDKRLDAVDSRLDSLDKRVGSIESDLRYFYSLTGRLDGRLEAIEKKG